jgi:hypothetical protein
MPKKRSAETLVRNAQSANADLSLAKATSSATQWKHRYEDAVASAVSLERQMDLLIGINGEPAIRRFERVKKSNSRGVAVVIPASDWHVEERVFGESTDGKNQFDLAEAEKRIGRFYAKAVELIDWQCHMAPVAEIWHPLLGDLLTGYIHEELMETNSLSPTEACVFLQEMICSGIDLLVRETKLPIYVPTCVGNHGRTTAKKRIKTSHRNSFEWLLYKTLAKHYSDNYHVRWSVGNGYHNIQEIMGRTVRFHHGDGLRYQGGIGGITIPANKKIAQWQKVRTVDFDIFGHWHQYLHHYPSWVCCPSLIGYTEFSVEIGAEFQHPAQAFIVIDRALGITLATPIYLTDPKRK